MSVVLVLPPLDRISLHEITPKDAEQVTVLSLLENLVMQKVVRQPSALLEEESQQDGSYHVDGRRVAVVDQGAAGRPYGKVGDALVDIEPLVGLEHTHHNELGPQFPVSLLKGQLSLVLVFDALWDKVANVELLHHCLRSRSVESGKDISHVIASVREDDPAARMFMPVGHIVHLVHVDDPSIVRSPMLLHLGPSVLGYRRGHLASILLGRLQDRISTHSHGHS